MKTLITGATGLLGRRLVEQFDDVVVLARNPPDVGVHRGSQQVMRWQPAQEPPPEQAFDDVDTVIHLAGEPVATGRWTDAKKRAIRDSRVLGTRHLVAAMKGLQTRPRVLVCASAVGWYGDRGDAELTETAAHGTSFLADVCAAWEAEAMKAAAFGVRVVTLRTGVVLAAEGGALKRMLPVFRMGLGGVLGNGQQWMPWIHIDDVVGLLLHAASTETVQGPLNAVAPDPATNSRFTRELGRALGRPAIMRIPSFALRAALGEMSGLLTTSQRVLPAAATATGYQFLYSDLRAALDACLEQTNNCAL